MRGREGKRETGIREYGGDAALMCLEQDAEAAEQAAWMGDSCGCTKAFFAYKCTSTQFVILCS